MADTALSFENLGHFYRTGRWVFRHYTEMIPRGSVFALLGPNGCGKTTLLKALLRSIVPAEGSVEIGGRCAYVPQLFQTTFDFTALDMVLMGRARSIGLFSQPGVKDESAALARMDRLGIAELAHQPFHELSGGQRQLVIFARALVAEAEILILDEPASALDLNHQAMILQWMEELAMSDGLTVVFTTHDPRHAVAVAERTLLMFGEQEYICGETEEVLTEDNLSRLYGLPIKQLSFEYDSRLQTTFAPVLKHNVRRE
jgi:iron complex transport system ATP-binding protein